MKRDVPDPNPSPPDKSVEPVRPAEQVTEIAHIAPSPSKEFIGQEDILAALQGLSQGLAEKGVLDVEIRIFGSGALICAFPGSRRLTTDLDAIVSSPIVLSLAEKIGDYLQFPEDWLNENVQVFDRPTLEFAEYRLPGCENLKILALTPRCLFAMKCFANRDRKDLDDIRYLAKKLGIKTLQQAELIFEKFYPGEAMGELAMVTVLDYCEGSYL